MELLVGMVLGILGIIAPTISAWMMAFFYSRPRERNSDE